MSAAAPSTGRVLLPVPPLDGESLLGWIARTAHRNALPSPYTILRRAGHAYADRPSTALSRLDRAPALALILGTDVESVKDRMFGPAPVPGFTELNGIVLRTRHVGTRTRRFSPSSLRADGVHRTVSMIRWLPFCATHWEYLSDACERCGAVQRWRHAGDIRRCDECNADLTRQTSRPIEDRYRPALSLIQGIASDGANGLNLARTELPVALHRLDRSELTELLLIIAMSVIPHIRCFEASIVATERQAALAKGLADAWRALESYPDGVFDLVVRSRRESRGGENDVISIIHETTHIRTLTGTAAAIGGLRTSLRHASSTIRIRPAAHALAAIEAEVSAARDAGIFKSHWELAAGRLLRSLDSDEVANLSKIRRTRLRRFKRSALLGLPPYGADELIANGILPADTHPWLVQRYDGPVVTREMLDDFLKKVRSWSRAPSSAGEAMSLRTVMRGFGGGPKPWGVVFSLLAAGEVPFTLSNDGVTTATIMVPKDAWATLWRLECSNYAAEYSRHEGLEILNLMPLKAPALADLRLEGRDGRAPVLDGTKVATAARERMTYAEISIRTGLDAAAVRRELLGRGVEAPSRLGWDRAQVLELATDMRGVIV